MLPSFDLAFQKYDGNWAHRTKPNVITGKGKSAYVAPKS